VRRLLRPLDDIGAGARRFGTGDFAQPIAPCAAVTSWVTWPPTINTMAASIHQMLEAKRTLLLAISHELRSPHDPRAPEHRAAE
jgi:signal transduction histidine kinase